MMWQFAPAESGGGGGSGITDGTPVTVGSVVPNVDLTGIPSTAKRVTVVLSNFSIDGTGNLLIQLGNSGAWITSGYLGGAFHWANTSQAGVLHGAGFIAVLSLNARQLYGSFTLVKAASGVWGIEGGAGYSVSNGGTTLAGVVPGVGTLSRIRLSSSDGANIDSGTVYYFWE